MRTKNTVALQKQFISRAQILAHVMTSTQNIKVTISGTQAYRQPGLINLPAGDYSDPDFEHMAYGWIDHELGHEDETDFEVTQIAAQESMLLNDLRQIIEDVRMEKSRGIKFRGARIRLERLAELAIKRGLFAEPRPDCEPLTVIEMLCLYYGRAHIIGQSCLTAYADSAKQIATGLFGAKLTQDICSVIDRIDHAKDNAHSLALARELMALLENELEQQQSNEPNDDDQEQDQNQDEDNSNSNADNSEGEGESNQGQGKGQNQDQDAGNDEPSNSTGNGSRDGSDDDSSDDSTGNQQSGQGDSEPQDGSTSSSGSSSSQEPSSQDIVNALNQLLSGNADGLEDFHEALSQYLSEQAEEAQSEQPELADMPNHTIVRSKRNTFNGLVDEMTATRLSGGVYQTMHKVLHDQVQSLASPRKTGARMINRKLAGIPAGNRNVFKRHIEQHEVSAAVSVMVDASGSMGARYNDYGVRVEPNAYQHPTLMTHANTCALAFAKGLDKSGVAVEVSYFGIRDGADYASVIAKEFEQKTNAKQFTAVSSSGTPTGEMMMYTLSTLALRPEDNKMLIIITDGAPDSAETVIAAAEIAKSLGIKVIPIGLCTNKVEGFSAGEFVNVNNPVELTSALREAVKLKLFK